MHIAQDPVSNLTLGLFNVNSDTAYVELTDQELILSEGNLFKDRFSLDQMGRAERITWEWYMGLGVRTDFQGLVAPITSLDNVIEIPLLQSKEVFIPILGPLGLQVPCRRLVLSLQDADAFLEEFNQDRVDPNQGPTKVPID